MTDEERQELAALRAALARVEGSVSQLDERLLRLEAAAAPPGPATVPPAAPARPGASSAPASASAAPAAGRAGARAPARRTRSGPSFGQIAVRWLREFLTEGNPLNKLGALSMIFGAAIVFRYAVDSGWIGPTGRVALGLVVGALLVGAGEVYARRGWHRFASGLVSAGNGVIFIAVWFGQQQYGVVPPVVSFGLYVMVTAFVVAQSLRYDSLVLAVWGLVGGYLAPALASTGSGNYAFLSSYLLVLNAGVFAIAYRRDWQPLKWMAFAITIAYTGSWVFAFDQHPGATRWLQLHWLLPFLAAFFLSFAAIPTWRSLRLHEPIDFFGQVLTVANGVVHFLFAVVALEHEHRAWLGLVAAVVAGLYAVVSSRLTREAVLDTRCLRVFAGSAAGFLLLATPYLASGHWITLVWCGETVLLAWACTQPRFAFLRGHVLAMLAIVLIRLVAFDDLVSTTWAGEGTRYIPFAELRSWPPFAAVATFALVARLLGRAPQVRLPGLPVGVLMGIGGLLLVAAVDGEAARVARYALLPHGSGSLQSLVRAGLLVSVIFGLWVVAMRSLGSQALAWLPSLFLAVALVFWTLETLVWAGSYGQLVPIVGDGMGLWWLHGGVLLMAPLLVLLAWLGAAAPERAFGFSRAQLQGLLFGTALVVAMLLLRRETFAITHAPPFADLIPAEAQRASYRSILSVSYALMAFGVYVTAIRTGQKARLYAAYALYVFTALKVYLFDLEFQNQLYRASSLIIFAAILFVSSYYANRRQAAEHA